MPNGGGSSRISHRPRLGITLGDPLGIGPEIVVKALCHPVALTKAHYRVFGSARVLARAAELAGLAEQWRRRTHASAHARPHVEIVDELQEHEAISTAEPGPTAAGGDASWRWLEQAIAAAKAHPEDPGHVNGIVTAPISKTSWHLAGKREFPGHTEMLAARFALNPAEVGMLFVSPGLNVMLATIHIPLSRVRGALSTDGILRTIRLAHRGMREMGVDQPRIGVAGLNPHAGEAGLMGDEEGEIIEPAIARARAELINASGPFPGDTVFNAAASPPLGKGLFDCVVAMYHDQGLIPVKLLNPRSAVNMTVGLPTVRTSPAHGTAFDIAWNRTGGPAGDERSMLSAIEVAVDASGASPRVDRGDSVTS